MGGAALRLAAKATLGSPHAWLMHHRIEKAKGLLMSSARVLADVALDCGFADQSHLTRTFQRVVGMTPGAWRRLHRR
jgi:AraC family transcriptional regulator